MLRTIILVLNTILARGLDFNFESKLFSLFFGRNLTVANQKIEEMREKKGIQTENIITVRRRDWIPICGSQ